VKYLTIFFRLLMINLYLFQKLSQSAETHTVPYTLTCIRIIGNMEKNSLFKKGWGGWKNTFQPPPASAKTKNGVAAA